MSKIKVMDNILSNKIAAGEVIEKTMNVVKELVENSIDAKANDIKIELIDSGVKKIKVTDNGVGMDKEDTKNAFLRHATSKLFDLDDLFNIETLGFRGEALPSIASVAKVLIKTSNGSTGTKMLIEGGIIKDITNSDLQIGTSICVTNLFYNTPVRLKYMKNLYVELANITDYVNKMALSYPNIKFTLINNDKVLLRTFGDNDLLKVIYAIYGADTTKKMIEVTGSDEDYNVHGFISYPEVTKANRNSITTFVNGRLIKNNNLNRVIVDTYHTYIPKDKFPIIVLNIETDPILIDINIHPTKMDIKFSKEKELHYILENIIKEKLENLLLIPSATVRNETAVKEVLTESVSFNYQPSKTIDFDTLENNKTELEDFEINTKEETYEKIKLDFEVQESTTDTYKSEERIKKLIPKGIVSMTYIIAENEDGMYIIDQHAAAERINYEKYLKQMSSENKNITDMLLPIKIELPNNEYIIIKENLQLLNTIGIITEEFGSNTFIIRSHPTWLKEGYEEQSLRKIFDLISEREKFSKEKFIEKAAITLACRMSIKANDYISLDDMQYLLDTLRKCDNPFTCPHGRPTIITYTWYDLEKMFKRAMD